MSRSKVALSEEWVGGPRLGIPLNPYSPQSSDLPLWTHGAALSMVWGRVSAAAGDVLLVVDVPEPQT